MSIIMYSKINSSSFHGSDEQDQFEEEHDPLSVLIKLPEGKTQTSLGQIWCVRDTSIPGREKWEVKLKEQEQDQIGRWKVNMSGELTLYSTGNEMGMTTQWDEQQIGTDECFEVGLNKARRLARVITKNNQKPANHILAVRPTLD